MSKLVVYKASAGSGKTFTLAISYIKLLIENPRAYQEILAVTFTNKATAEMKDRIIKELYGIYKSDQESESYLNKIIDDTGLEENHIRKQAGKALTYMLHDYSRFRVETIDSFFQSIMRNLARELELSPNLNVELNSTEVLSESVDSMIEKLETNSIVLGWLLSYINEQIADNKRWNVADDIKNFSRNILKEEYIAKGENLRTNLKDPKLIPTYRKELRAIEREALEQMKGFQQQFLHELSLNNLSVDDLLRKTSGIASYFNKLSNGILSDDVRNVTAQNCLSDPEAWCTKTHPRKNEIVSLASSSLMPLLRDAEKLRPRHNRIINSCQLSLQHLNKLQLLAHIDEEMRLLNKQKNRFLLADTNALLRSLIRDGDSSFIFEKTGASIRNIMIDEFQDTSSMQWENFQLLLLEGLSQGADSLIVGDVKQSIYRWRSGDWTILNELGTEGDKHFGSFPIKTNTLDTNYRSETNVIEFNNVIFPAIINKLDNQYKEEFAERNEALPNDDFKEKAIKGCIPLKQAYSDVQQKSNKKTNKGFVQIEFLEGSPVEEYEEATLAALVREVQNLVNHGVDINDIAILVRKNRSISTIADYFNYHLNYPIVSDEAFRLGASTSINLMMDAIRYLSDSENKIIEANLALSYQKNVLDSQNSLDKIILGDIGSFLPQEFIDTVDTLRELPLYELLERLFALFELKNIKGQDAYLFSFFDKVIDYLQKESSLLDDFLQFWDEKLSNETIPSGEISGIRVLSIHKSKGLEFHTVFVPFCDWPLESERIENLIWCTPELPPFNDIDIVPINYSKKMEESIYLDDYLHERLQLWVDNINLLYVAFTRAESNLFLFCKQGSRNDVSELIADVLPTVAIQQEITYDPEEGLYKWGEINPSKALIEKQTNNVFRIKPNKKPIRMESLPHDFEFKQSNRSIDFIQGIEEDESPMRFISRGKLLHELFASINVLDDIEPSIRQLRFDGLIGSQEDEDKIRALTTKAFKNPKVQEWYTNDWDLFNECAIIYTLDGRLETRRPDRVMVNHEKAILVDFKFGKPQKTYSAQVKEYIKLLEQMDYTNVEGYIWYVTQDKIERV